MDSFEKLNHLIGGTGMIFASYPHLEWQTSLSAQKKKAQTDWRIDQKKIKYLAWHFKML